MVTRRMHVVATHACCDGQLSWTARFGASLLVIDRIPAPFSGPHRVRQRFAGHHPKWIERMR